MAIKLNAAYSKKLGLPNYSSHSFAASVEVELTDPGSIASETARLYATLQSSVDNEIRQTGYLPGVNESPASSAPSNSRSGNGASNGNGANSRATTPISNGNGRQYPEGWRCSDKQRQLITRLITENGVDHDEINALAEERFGCGLTALNRLQASGLIDEMLETYGRKNGNGSHRRPPAGANRNGGGA